MPPILGYTHCICADIMAPSSIRTCNSELLRVICLLCGFSLSFFSCSCSKLIFYILHFFSYLAFLPSISFSFSSPPTYVTNVKHLAPYFSVFISCTHGEEDHCLFDKNGILYARITSCFSCLPVHNIFSN